MSRGRRRPDAAAGEQGFTLIEVIVSIVLLTLITGGISAALVTSINATKGSEQRTKGTNDAQIVAAFLNKDAQAAGGTDPSTGVADPSLGVKTPATITASDQTECGWTGNLVVRFKWIDRAPEATTHIANYSVVPETGQLLRTICDDGGGPTPQTLANEIVATASPQSPFAWCDGAEGATCPTFPNTVSMRLTESNSFQATATPYTYTLTATLRPQADAQPDLTTPTQLILFGSSDCSTGATGLDVGSGSTLSVYGQTYIDTANGSGCNAMKLAGSSFFGPARYHTLGTSILAPGTCATSGPTNGCPTVNPYSTHIIDPYEGLAAPDPSGMPHRSLGFLGICSGNALLPGYYSQTPLAVGGTCTLSQSGVYYFNQGLAVGLGGTLKTAPGVHTLIYVANGQLNAGLGATFDVTGMSAGDPYPGLAIWQAASDTSAMSFGVIGTFNVNGNIYARNATISNSVIVQNHVTGIVAETLAVSGGVTTTVGVPPPPPTIAAATLPDATQGQPYSTPPGLITASGGVPPYSWSESGLPSGLHIDQDTGVISGTPNVNSAGGTLSFTVTATDDFDIAGPPRTFQIRIISAPVVNTVSPSPRGQGWTGNVTINGSNFYSGATVSFSGTGVTVNGSPSVNGAGTQIAANISIASSAATGPRDVTVTNTDGAARPRTTPSP